MPRGNPLQLARQKQPGLGHRFQKIRLPDTFKNGESGRTHQRVTVERAALIAMFETGCSFGRKQCSERHAAADALAERHYVRLDSRMLVMKELSGPPHAGLDLVDDEQQTMRLGQ